MDYKEAFTLKELIDNELTTTPLFMVRDKLYEAIIGHITRKFALASLVATPDEKKRLDALYAHIIVGV